MQTRNIMTICHCCMWPAATGRYTACDIQVDLRSKMTKCKGWEKIYVSHIMRSTRIVYIQESLI